MAVTRRASLHIIYRNSNTSTNLSKKKMIPTRQSSPTCKQYMNLHTFVDPVSVTNTLYQEISFSESTEKPDKCLTLDDTLQICNSYRPQYHEYFVHFPAAYLLKLQRALFVGGGDSMLLHELLKYPDLDLILGLALDQQVVRQSLKHFYTQPHFDNPKVQWWFGDAATSLSLLPIEYYGTFDLVMVDLSETVMSASVTDQMDILHALSLLLHPEDGIFIKNERYMSELSNVFEHVMQIYLHDCPLICDQDWVLGSHGIDLLHPDFDRLLGKYNIQTFHYRPRENHFALIKYYAKNDISCMINERDESTTTSDEYNHENRTKHGIFIALEAEGAMRISQPDFILKEELLKALQRHTELRIRIVAPEYEEGGNHIFILMHEGYITTTCWADMQYCQADLVFWSRFDHVETTKNAILQAVGVSKPPSLYRIVVGGVSGVDDEVHKTGPKLDSGICKEQSVCMQYCNDDDIYRSHVAGVAFSESLSLHPTRNNVVVFCGVPFESACDTLASVVPRERNENLKILAVWECDGAEAAEPDIHGAQHINRCNKSSVEGILIDVTSENGKIDLVLIDSAVKSSSVIDIANALTKKPFLDDNSLIILPTLGQAGQYFLEICRLKARGDMLRMTLLSFHQGDGDRVETIGYLSRGNANFMQNITSVAERIARKTAISASLVSMKSSPVARQDLYSPHHYTMFDYDEAPGMEQYSTQKPLGKQSLLQIRLNTTTITDGMVKAAATEYLSSMGRPSLKIAHSAVGDGTIIHAAFDEGFLVVLWGGRDTIDANIFSYNQSFDHKKLFEESFAKIFKLCTLTQRDEQPRGFNRVVNLSSDIRATAPRCVDRFVVCEKLAEFGECEVESEMRWMHKNCPISCGACPDERAIT